MIPHFVRIVEYNILLTRKTAQLQFFTLKWDQTVREVEIKICQITMNDGSFCLYGWVDKSCKEINRLTLTLWRT